MCGVVESSSTIFLSILCCCSCHVLPRDDKDFTELQKQKPELASNSFLVIRNSTSWRELSRTPNSSSTPTRSPRKWHMGRVTRKQYEIINLLWRKTKIFVNVENTTPAMEQDNITKKMFDLIRGQNPIIFSRPPAPVSPSSTPSFIEFYYSDETDDQAKQNHCGNGICQPSRNNNSSFLVFHIKGPLSTKTKGSHSTELSSQSPLNILSFITVQKNKLIKNKPFEVSSEIRTRTVPSLNKETKTPNFDLTVRKIKYQTQPTTVYDKIKFFELYDKHTLVPFAKKANMLEFNYNEKTVEDIEINQEHKILLEHVDQSSHEHNEARHSKKHITENKKYPNESYYKYNSVHGNIKTEAYRNDTTEIVNITSNMTNRSLQSEQNESKTPYSYINKSVSWFEYPFTAVYIYEPSQVHCDAASISAHWLVASGSCLSRLNQSPALGEGRSAFVAYCGESWWRPERVSYVKYSAVHPWYHPRDKTRRHLYNIGVIQVETSMLSACNGWAPVSLMSHQFAANRGGSEALALGWGLDRFDTRYAATDLPKYLLTLYKGLLYSDSCPGNIGYGKVKRLDEGGGVKNVYCLSLPPYSGEDHDPVHGSLLLVGGKLIALYLQEERRQWGEQSAQYTGIWHLIPWVVDVAREPEDEQSLTDEM